jgi:hypothetical protein
MEEYRRLLWNSLQKVEVKITLHSADIKTLTEKINDYDGGRTALWVKNLDNRVNYLSLRTNLHTIHIVTDRSTKDILPELRRGLELMTWMSAKPLIWYWWDQPWDRSLPPSIHPRPEHLNGGWAVPGIPEVYVYRREEALKVMIHESIHACLLDVRPELVASVLTEFETVLNRKLWPHLGECYTELLAEFLWSIAQAKTRADARSLWALQIQCSTKQAGQVWARIHNAHENERTNVFAYYILKWVLMQHEEVFFGPNHCVSKWLPWFKMALPQLEEMAKTQAHSETKTLSLAMTCPP